MAAIPRPIVSVLGEDVYVEVPGLLRIAASFLSEGLFDERAGGDPAEEDLYEVEVTHARGALLEPITFPRLMPAAPAGLDDDFASDGGLPMEQFLMTLAWELAHAPPSEWDRVCQAARAWDAWQTESLFQQLPPDWTPEPLIPDED